VKKPVSKFAFKSSLYRYIEGKLLPGEVFLCTTVNTNPIQSIEGHATILTLEEFEAERKRSAAEKKGGKKGKAAGSDKELFVCR
jgi:hypothetical protein